MDDLTTISRADYREGQLLRAADLQEEQRYLIAARGKHAITSHRRGIVRGLELTIKGSKLTVSSGAAVDGLGRSLVVSKPIDVPLAAVQNGGISIWLVYDEETRSDVPERVRESAQVRAGAAADLPGRHAETDEAAEGWPIYLGTVRRVPGTGDFETDLTGRPMTGLAGAAIDTPSGLARVRCGEDFALSLAAGETKPFLDAFAISKGGRLRIQANAVRARSLRIQTGSGGVGQGRPGLGLSLGPACKSARPWQAYRAETLRENQPSIHSLVFELQGAQGKEDPEALNAVVGHSADQQFQSTIRISSDGNVTVAGVLRVGGRLIESPIAPDASDPRFMAALATGTTALLDPSAVAFTVHIQPGSKKDHSNLEYSLVFQNHGRESVQIVEARTVTRLNGQLERQVTLPLAGVVLDPGKEHRLEQAVHLPSPGKVDIGIGVLATAANIPVSANHKVAFQVT